MPSDENIDIIDEILPKKVFEFKDIHAGEFIMVCGLGASLNLLLQDTIDRLRLTCIGVNDIARFRKVKYCYYQDNFKWMKTVVDRDMFEIKKYHICNYTAENLFVSNGVFWDLVWDLNNEPNVVQFYPMFFDVNDPLHFCKLIDMDLPAEILENNRIITSLSTIGAISLAYYMGARKIGIIGMDISSQDATDNNALHPEINDRTKSMLTGTKIFMNLFRNKLYDCEIYNFSPYSNVFNDYYDINDLEDFL